MTAYLINHLRIPGGVPKPDALTYLEQVEVLEGAWPGSVVLMEFPDLDTAKEVVRLARVPGDHRTSYRQHHL